MFVHLCEVLTSRGTLKDLINVTFQELQEERDSDCVLTMLHCRLTEKKERGERREEREEGKDMGVRGGGRVGD